MLAPLGLARSDVWFTDAVNTYFVKVNDSQGKAHSGRFRAFADQLSLAPNRRPQIPARPTPASLVHTALAEHRERLLAEIETSQAPLIVTLGNEALATIGGLADDHRLPARLDRDDYGGRVPVLLGARTVDVLPLKHPGNRSKDWADAHAHWITGAAN